MLSKRSFMKLIIKRLDHFGLIAGKMKELGMVKMINDMLGVDKQQNVTSGHAVLAMILNGLGFVDRPLSLTPQFFENQAVDVLLDPGIVPEHLNHYRLGRVLDKIGEFGCERFFNTIAMTCCKSEGVDCENHHNDTTTYSVHGKYEKQDDMQEVTITRGYSKDMRKDLKQLVIETIAAGDGSVPFLAKIWSGNASDSKILAERTKNLVTAFSESEEARCLIADSKLYSEANVTNLSRIKFITRIPATIKYENMLIERAIQENVWTEIDEKNRFHEYSVNHFGIEQRWTVVYSEQALSRAKKLIEKNIKSEEAALKKELYHFQARQYACEADSISELERIEKRHPFYKIESYDILKCKKHEKAGRPLKESLTFIYKVKASFKINDDELQRAIQQRSCYVIGTNILASELSANEIVSIYKEQDKVEKVFAFLKSPSFFASSVFLKNVNRIQALLTVMLLSVLMYSIVQRALRRQLKLSHLTVPNQIKKPIDNPTLKWIFRCFEGINYIKVEIDGVVQYLVDGLNELRVRVIRLLGDDIKSIYKIS